MGGFIMDRGKSFFSGAAVWAKRFALALVYVLALVRVASIYYVDSLTVTLEP